jgi:predicted nucleotidyltransferase
MSDQPSGRFVLRIDPALHGALRSAAEAAGLSLNEYCARKLASEAAVWSPAVDVVARATSLLGARVWGILVFGSWARGEAVAGSDVDVLVVVDDEVALTRRLYHEWDEAPLKWEAHPVEAHFVHLPEAGARLSALWAEAAVDGVVLYDRSLEVSRRLVEIRDRIAAGELVRRRVHGQRYWVEAA